MGQATVDTIFATFYLLLWEGEQHFYYIIMHVTRSAITQTPHCWACNPRSQHLMSVATFFAAVRTHATGGLASEISRDRINGFGKLGVDRWGALWQRTHSPLERIHCMCFLHVCALLYNPWFLLYPYTESRALALTACMYALFNAVLYILHIVQGL